MKILIKSIAIAFLLAIIFFYLISNKSFTVTNYTGEPIRAMNFQFERLDTEPSIAEMESYENRYTIGAEHSKNFKVLIRNRFNRTLYVGIDFSYKLRDPEKEEYYNLRGTTFSSEPQFVNQKSYCKFQIDVYPNNKTIVTPLKRFCFKPFYYHSN